MGSIPFISREDERIKAGEFPPNNNHEKDCVGNWREPPQLRTRSAFQSFHLSPGVDERIIANARFEGALGLEKCVGLESTVDTQPPVCPKSSPWQIYLYEAPPAAAGAAVCIGDRQPSIIRIDLPRLGQNCFASDFARWKPGPEGPF
jgi:hypothetical protein